jgi:hypothetical protein
MVAVETNLAGNYLTVLRKMAFKVCGGIALWDAVDKHVFVGESLFVGTK